MENSTAYGPCSSGMTIAFNYCKGH